LINRFFRFLAAYEAEDVLEEVLSQHSGQQSSFRSSQSRNSLQAENEDGYSDDSPGPEKWSHSILDLLADVDGNRLFTEFLTDHSWQQALYFYLAVNGMKQQTRPNVPHLIYNRWIKPEKMLLPLQLTDTTREKITSTFQPLKPIDLVSHDVFDEAQQEALDFMQQHIHRLFIESEKYLNYVNDYRNQV
jgi:Regulator of G protein signaling domain